MAIYIDRIDLLAPPYDLEEVYGGWWEAYVLLAVAFDATLSNRPYDLEHLKEALFVLIDLDSSDYGTEASTRLTPQMDLLYRQAKLHYSYDDWRNKMVKEINDFTIEYFGDLDDFVNSLLWPDSCVPYYWAELTENGGIDTSNWILCS
jgi:hypothetical protein